MQRTCAHCGKSFTAKRPTAKYCSSSCRGKATHARQQGKVVDLAARQAEEQPTGGLVAITEERLRDADLLDTPGGQQVLLVARRMTTAVSDAAVAGLSKEYRTLLAEVLAGTEEPDGLDDARQTVVEFRRRRSG